jgi:hypothetical protein
VQAPQSGQRERNDTIRAFFDNDLFSRTDEEKGDIVMEEKKNIISSGK